MAISVNDLGPEPKLVEYRLLDFMFSRKCFSAGLNGVFGHDLGFLKRASVLAQSDSGVHTPAPGTLSEDTVNCYLHGALRSRRSRWAPYMMLAV